jgi:hypothetical protein
MGRTIAKTAPDPKRASVASADGSNQKTFDFRRRFRGISSAIAARSPIPPKRMGIRRAKPRAEKRVSFRGVLKRHLSVVFREVHERVE